MLVILVYSDEVNEVNLSLLAQLQTNILTEPYVR